MDGGVYRELLAELGALCLDQCGEERIAVIDLGATWDTLEVDRLLDAFYGPAVKFFLYRLCVEDEGFLHLGGEPFVILTLCLDPHTGGT